MERDLPAKQHTDIAGDNEDIQTLLLLYTENAKVAATFWEWRHKVMERFFASLVAVLAAAGWLYQQKELRRLLFVPLLLGAIFSIVSFLMDRVNRKILLGCYRTGKALEQQLGPYAGAYTRLLDDYVHVNYSVFLRALYVGAASLFLVLATLSARFLH